MEILEMIAEWRTGCTCAPPEHPEECVACTINLISAIENKEKVQAFSGCITPNFYKVIERLSDAASIHPKNGKQQGLASTRLVDRNDINSLLHEFFRLDSLLRKKYPHVFVESQEESHRVT